MRKTRSCALLLFPSFVGRFSPFSVSGTRATDDFRFNRDAGDVVIAIDLLNQRVDVRAGIKAVQSCQESRNPLVVGRHW